MTHDQAEAFAVSDRVAVVLEGEVAQVDRPQCVYSTPIDLRVAAFVGRISVLRPVERIAENKVRIAGVAIANAHFARDVVDGAAAVRPEAVAITTDGALPGRVVRASYLGDRRELVVATDAGEVRVDVESTKKIEANDNVRLDIRECNVFPL